MNRSTFFWLFLPVTLVYIIGFGVEVMGVDSAQYAAISREMTETGEYLQVHLRGKDYLDKPPLLFWVNSLFFNLFGYANWSFKIGSFLFTLLGVFSTFKLGKLLYNANTGRLAAIILYCCQAFFLFNNDVRTDTILTGSTIFAIWMLLEWLERKRWKWLIGASVGLALSMLAKGPIGLMVPALAIGSYLLGKNRWREIFRWEYLVMLALVGVLLSPMLWGLYHQFDKHPEKGVMMPTSEGMQYETGISGLRFYFWTQSFGRITGESNWSDGSGPFFFVHNLLWAFLPWSLLFVIAFFKQLTRIIRGFIENHPLPELLTAGGFLLPFIAFSMSSYKLPHYIFILFPLAAIITAHWWQEIWESDRHRRWRGVSLFAQVLVWAAVGAVLYFIYFRFFPGTPLWILVLSIAVLGISSYFLLKGLERMRNVIIASVLASLTANFGLNAWFYPNLTEYQVGEKMITAMKANQVDLSRVYPYNFYTFSFHYYMGFTDLPRTNDRQIKEELAQGQKVYLVTKDPYLPDVMGDFEADVLFQMGTHSVTRLSMKFLKPETRAQTLQQVYLVEILAPKEDQ